MTPVEAWLATYYPETAQECVERGHNALEHSLRKWTGLQPDVLERHGLVADGGAIMAKGSDTPILEVDATTCALCEQHTDAQTGETKCEECSLTEVRGVACDRDADGDDDVSPYHQFIWYGRTEPMIDLLTLARDRRAEGLIE